MKQVIDLVWAAKEVIKIGDRGEAVLTDPINALEVAITKCEEFLVASKTFEYTGEITMNGGAVIKLSDLKSDLDDIMRAIAEQRDFKRQGWLGVVLFPEGIEKPAEVVLPLVEASFCGN